MLSSVFERFAQRSPLSVIMRGLMERTFAAAPLNRLFEATAQEQYTRELLFSDIVDLMSPVVCALEPSLRSAYRHQRDKLSVSLSAVYAKLNGIELPVSEALLGQSAESLQTLMSQLSDLRASWVPGYRVKILDGNCLAATDHRLSVQRRQAASVLPGKSLVVLEPQWHLATHLFACEDGHAQERSLLPRVLETAQPQDAWIADRNMCTLGFLMGLHRRQAAFVIREHQKLPYRPLDDLQAVASAETGAVFEQPIVLERDGETLTLRRIVVHLDTPTRDGETTLAIVTSLPNDTLDALAVADLYRRRWSIETFFQSVTVNLEGEIQTLAYPKAALFSFSLALVIANLLSALKATLAAVHGRDCVAQLSDYYLVNEIRQTYGGMMIAIEPQQWQIFQTMPLSQVVKVLKSLAANVSLKPLRKATRGPKKKRPALIADSRHRHLSTARLLEQASNSP